MNGSLSHRCKNGAALIARWLLIVALIVGCLGTEPVAFPSTGDGRPTATDAESVQLAIRNAAPVIVKQAARHGDDKARDDPSPAGQWDWGVAEIPFGGSVLAWPDVGRAGVSLRTRAYEARAPPIA